MVACQVLSIPSWLSGPHTRHTTTIVVVWSVKIPTITDNQGHGAWSKHESCHHRRGCIVHAGSFYHQRDCMVRTQVLPPVTWSVREGWRPNLAASTCQCVCHLDIIARSPVLAFLASRQEITFQRSAAFSSWLFEMSIVPGILGAVINSRVWGASCEAENVNRLLTSPDGRLGTTQPLKQGGFTLTDKPLQRRAFATPDSVPRPNGITEILRGDMFPAVSCSVPRTRRPGETQARARAGYGRGGGAESETKWNPNSTSRCKESPRIMSSPERTGILLKESE